MEDARPFAAEPEVPAGVRDEELAIAARSDPAAFGLLYRRHRLAVFRYLRSRTRSDDDAAELTATTFERAMAAIHRYRPAGAGILAWFLRIARNAAIDAGRRRATAPLPPGLADGAEAASPEARALRAESIAAVVAALNALPEPQREAIVLRFAAGLTAREIGEVLGKREAATQKLISRAMDTLREACRDDA